MMEEERDVHYIKISAQFETYTLNMHITSFDDWKVPVEVD